MPSRALLRAFLLLWFVTGVVLFIGSVDTVREAVGRVRHVNPHLVLLGMVEGIAAALFLAPRSMRLGAVSLLVTIGVAFVIHVALGEFRGDLLLYAAAVLFVAVHGSLTSPQWRAALLPNQPRDVSHGRT
jgi:hypothetical protein